MLESILQQWQPVCLAGGLIVFWLWETAHPFFVPRRRWRHALRNLLVAALNAVVLGAVFGSATVELAGWSARTQTGLLYHLPLSPWAHALAAFLLLDCWTYWWHRANHRIPFLWRFHRMHHSDPDMDVTTATRFHAGELAMSAALQLALIPILGMPLVSVLAHGVILVASTQFHHANLALPEWLDRAVRVVVVSPFMHKVHHSRRQPETDSNYCSILSLWDRLFGSFRTSSAYQAIRLGLDGYDSDERQSVRGLLLTPLWPGGR